MPKNSIISPISIDLGAKNTGVYFAHYSAGSSLEDIEKEGKVYQLDKDKYTLMMVNRTVTRHRRRGYKRRQMVKRLFRLIWREEFGLEWNDDIQQTVSFLLNRRGFSFLTEEYNAEDLKQFPKEAFDSLPLRIRDEIGSTNGESYDLNEKIFQWKEYEPTKFLELFESIDQEAKKIKHKLFLISCTGTLKTFCEAKIRGDEIRENKNRKNKPYLPEWVLDAWENQKVEKIDQIRDYGKTINLAKKINQLERETAEKILNSVPNDFDSDKTRLNESKWNFHSQEYKRIASEFKEPDKSNESSQVAEKARQEWLKTHIHHFAFALYKVKEELTSGARHRSKYFEEINNVLTRENHTHGYLRYFCTKLLSGEYKPHTQSCLTPETLTNLIGHLSNLELKPLRKYFNGAQHKNGDCWEKERLNKLFGRWILREWRVNLDKDLDKAEGAKGDYISLREKWESHKDDVVDFWLQEPPNFTIPPYQDNNNRRPPKCQSLVQNPKFLDREYPNWQTWVSQLNALQNVKDFLGDYQTNLETLESGKRKPYFSHELTGNLQSDSGRRTRKDMDARILQFILDRVKGSDPLRLNEIYSHTKKFRQSQSTFEKKEIARKDLENSIEHSELPDTLKTVRHYQDKGVFTQGSFLHLVCNYYKIRQNARDGRVFIHPEYRNVQGRGYEKTGRFDDGDHLLTYCNHTPRQKRHQLVNDLAGLFHLLPQQVEEKTEAKNDIQLTGWLEKNFSGLKSNCAKAAEEQKKRRGGLKGDIETAYADRNADRTLHGLITRAQRLCRELREKLKLQSEHEVWNRTLDHPVNAVFLLAQIYNIAFKERSGKARTCAVCSLDNAQRMQFYDNSVKAQRLAAIPTRLIDGAVMRLARILGHAIADDKWRRIKSDLEVGSSVRVPIITESNRFEFEPSLEKLKGRRPDTNSKAEKMLSKSDRIKGAANNISPYSGDGVGDDGDLDHIIPRSHPIWGTLNDEANLIYTSALDNRDEKSDHKHFTLSNLDDKYKITVFKTNVNSEIENWIKATIWDEDKEDFTFGRYLSFVNLTPDQQKAFRHALFLKDGDPLRKTVIDAINHGIKTLVNGTQRYFAEVLANELYKKAKAIKKHHLLSFDYFGVEAQDNSRGDGIRNLRYELENNYREDLKCYAKEDGLSQNPYSHLLDAQIAFCMIADAHRVDGGLRINLGDTGIWSRMDKSIRAVTKNPRIYDAQLFNKVEVKPDKMKVQQLKRRIPNRRNFSHRSIHRDTIYAEHYLPILVHKKTANIRIGFDWSNSFEFMEDSRNREKLYFALNFNPETKKLALTKNDSFEKLAEELRRIGMGMSRESEYFCIPLTTCTIHTYYIENYNMANGWKEYDSGMEFLRVELAYRTEKKKIESLVQAQKILNNKKNFQLANKTKSSVVLPIKTEWLWLVDEWTKSTVSDEREFLRKHFRIKEPSNKRSHERFRKVFSLPVRTDEGKLLLKRKSWNGKPVFQIVNDSDSRKIDAKVFIPVCTKDGDIGRLLSNSANSSNLFGLDNKNYFPKLTDEIREIDLYKWHRVKLDKDNQKFKIASLSYKIDNNTRPRVRLEFNKTPSQTRIDQILEKPLFKPKEMGKTKKQLQDELQFSMSVEYTGTGFSKEIRRVLSPVLKVTYFNTLH